MVDITDTAAIERDLARTRARMDGRLGELQDKLSPGTIVNDALAHFTGGDGAAFARDLVERLKANPLPALVTGIGLAWLMASSNRPAQPVRARIGGSDITARLRAAEAEVVRQPDEHPDAHAGRIDDARGKVLGIARQASDTAVSYSQRIRDAMAAAAQSVRETTHDLTASASHAAHDFGNMVQRSSGSTQQGISSMTHSTRNTLSSISGNPLALGALAAVVGLLAESLIPTGEEEEHALGTTAGRLRAAGRDLAQDVVDRGGRIASETLGAVKDSADAHGLSTDKPIGEVVADLRSGALGDAVKQVAGETADAGRQSVQKHLGGDAGEQAGGSERGAD